MDVPQSDIGYPPEYICQAAEYNAGYRQEPDENPLLGRLRNLADLEQWVLRGSQLFFSL